MLGVDEKSDARLLFSFLYDLLPSFPRELVQLVVAYQPHRLPSECVLKTKLSASDVDSIGHNAVLYCTNGVMCVLRLVYQPRLSPAPVECFPKDRRPDLRICGGKSFTASSNLLRMSIELALDRCWSCRKVAATVFCSMCHESTSTFQCYCLACFAERHSAAVDPTIRSHFPVSFSLSCWILAIVDFSCLSC